jgi:hypothetical protein
MSKRIFEIFCNCCHHKAEISSEHDLFNPPYSKKLICTKCNERNARMLSVSKSRKVEVTFETASEFALAEDPYHGHLSDDVPYTNHE